MTADDRAGAIAELRRLLDNLKALRSDYVIQDLGPLEAVRDERHGAIVRTGTMPPLLVLKVNETWIPPTEADVIAQIVAASFNALPVLLAALDAAEAATQETKEENAQLRAVLTEYVTASEVLHHAEAELYAYESTHQDHNSTLHDAIQQAEGRYSAAHYAAISLLLGLEAALGGEKL